MRMKLQKISVDFGKITTIDHANEECPERLLDIRMGSLTAQDQQSVSTISDQEYVRSMEELYGIREEGIF